MTGVLAGQGLGAALITMMLGLLPAFVLLWLFVFRRLGWRSEVAWTALCLGALVGVPVAVLGLYLGIDGLAGRGSTLSIMLEATAIGVVEELGKLSMLLLFVRKHEDYQSDALVKLALAISLGFAAFENVFYVGDTERWGLVAAGRAIFAVPGHALDGVLMGLSLRVWAPSAEGRGAWLAGLPLAALLHGAYDGILFLAQTVPNRTASGLTALVGGVGVLVAGGILAAAMTWYLRRRARRSAAIHHIGA